MILKILSTANLVSVECKKNRKFHEHWSLVRYEGDVMEQIRAQTPVVLQSLMEESQVRIGRQAIFAKIAFFEDTYLTREHKAKLLMASIRLKILP